MAGLRPMFASVITIPIKTWLSTNTTWRIGGKRAGLRLISISTFTKNNVSNIEQGRLTDIFRPTQMSCTITLDIYYLGGRVPGTVPISNSTITINSIYCIVRVKVAGLFRPVSTSTIINSDITLLFFMNILVYKTLRYWWIQKYIMVALVMRGIMAGLRPISTYPFKINDCSPIVRGRLACLLWRRSTSTNISSAIMRGRVDGLKRLMSMTSEITWGRVAGLKRPMSTYFLIQRKLKTFFLGNFIAIVTAVGGRMAGCKIPIS